ncbi:MAG: prepilin-type N-terminal cleavage/methylation domain-containing protein [Verrucomicrobiales bacterium]|nr:prepilin-type N-terminal cleavage/methylation domain-containing protein [Verrucomicrobiales bacterium]
MKIPNRKAVGAFTLIELLIVIAIIAVLSGISLPAYRMMKEKAEVVNHVANLRNITNATLLWTSEHSQTLPSPQYPGGHQDNDPNIPEEWDFAGTGSGLWLDGVIYYATCYMAHNQRAEEQENLEEVDKVDGENGAHLKDTAFASLQSFRKNPLEQDWHRHSYAMNRSIQYDHIYAGSSEPELTNKNLAKLSHPNALLFIENEESNVIGFSDLPDILETAKKRWSSGQAIASFLDGSARTIAASEFPIGSRNKEDESSRFWSGVDADQFCGT